MTNSAKPTGEQPETSQVTVVVLGESDFSPDTHQVIPLEPHYGPPLVAKDSGGFKLSYSEVVHFQDIYYFESGCLWLGYTNSMLYDHPLDHQGHIASILHSSTAAYSSYIGLVTMGISIIRRVKNSDIHCHYFDIVGTIPGQDHHNIWARLHFLPDFLVLSLSCHT